LIIIICLTLHKYYLKFKGRNRTKRWLASHYGHSPRQPRPSGAPALRWPRSPFSSIDSQIFVRQSYRKWRCCAAWDGRRQCPRLGGLEFYGDLSVQIIKTISRFENWKMLTVFSHFVVVYCCTIFTRRK